jgi:hypothetical protein
MKEKETFFSVSPFSGEKHPILGCHNIRHSDPHQNGIQHNNTQHNDSKDNGNQHNDSQQN